MSRRAPCWVLFGLSAAGPLLVRLVLRRFGRAGGLVAEGVVCLLLARSVVMVLTGAPRRLQPLPRVLLAVEGAMDLVAAAIGGWAWVGRPFTGHVGSSRPAELRRADVAGRAAVWAIFIVHSARMGIFLSPGHGQRAHQAE